MNIDKFIRLRPYLFHLTDESNLKSILADLVLKSTKKLVEIIDFPEKENFLKTRRRGHKRIQKGSLSFLIRDQDPLYEKIVLKNLDKDMDFGDFVLLLNSHVFFWATEKDLTTHYARYEKQNESPIILKVKTEELFGINNYKAKFCDLNSGAPRCCSYYNEGAPPRGKNTFLSAADYRKTPSSVREVTFDLECKLPVNLFLSKHPSKSYRKIVAE